MTTTAQLLDSATALIADSWAMSPEEFDAALSAWIAEAGGKLDAIRAVAKAADSQRAAHKAEADAHLARVRACNATGDRAKHLAYALLCAMREAGEAPNVAGVARIQANGGKLPVVYDAGLDPRALPPEYQRVTVEADGDAIRAALEAGREVPGCVLGARGEGVRWA